MLCWFPFNPAKRKSTLGFGVTPFYNILFGVVLKGHRKETNTLPYFETRHGIFQGNSTARCPSLARSPSVRPAQPPYHLKSASALSNYRPQSRALHMDPFRSSHQKNGGEKKTHSDLLLVKFRGAQGPFAEKPGTGRRNPESWCFTGPNVGTGSAFGTPENPVMKKKGARKFGLN